jgi:putative endonuclease
MHYFYILRCKDGTLYCGSTNDLAAREKRHNAGKGSIYVRTHGGGKIIYTEKFRALRKAMQREVEIKKWPRIKKEDLIKNSNLKN